MKRVLLYSFLALFLLFLVATMAGMFRQVSDILILLPTGWWFFLKRNLAQVSANWTLVASGVLCSAIVLILGHRLLDTAWLRWSRIRHGAASALPWRWKWTLGLYAALWLLFTIALGVAGVFRHTTWLMRENGPWYHERRSAQYELRTHHFAIGQAARDSGEDLDSTRKALLMDNSISHTRYGPVYEDFSVVFFADSNRKVKEYLIIPRDPQLRERGLFWLSATNATGLLLPLSELGAAIKDLEARYPTSPEAMR